jgi:hypothetical protein
MTETRDLISSVVLLVVRIVILAIINLVFTELPMLKAVTIPGLPITIQSIISFVIGIIMIIALIAFRGDFISRLRSNHPSNPQIRTFITEAISLIIVLIGYTMFDGAIRPLMQQFSWLYPVFFLILALWPMYVLIITLYHNNKTIADWLFGKIAIASSTSSTIERKCPSCGKYAPYSAQYCPACGIPVASDQNNAKCTVCSAINKCTDRYCINCGTAINSDEQYETRVSV